LELYGLVSIVDEFIFGDLRSFRAQFIRAATAKPSVTGSAEEYGSLRERLRPVCQRTLRRQVSQYVAFTRRHALVQEFVPTAEEQRLYDLVSEYLQRPNLYALPSSQRQLMTLMLRKLLASSTYAISDTLAGLAGKLEEAERQTEATAISVEDFAENFELMPEIEEEWSENDEDSEDAELAPKQPPLTEVQRRERRDEIARLTVSSSVRIRSQAKQSILVRTRCASPEKTTWTLMSHRIATASATRWPSVF
jgi:hypothetical protein